MGVYDIFTGAGAFVLVAGLAWSCVRQPDQDRAGQRHARTLIPPSGSRRFLPAGPASIPHQPRKPHPSHLHHVQPTRTGLTWRLSAMWRVLGGHPKPSTKRKPSTLAIRHTLNS